MIVDCVSGTREFHITAIHSSVMLHEIRPAVYLENVFLCEDEESFRALSRGWRWAVMEVINLLSPPVLETCNTLFKTGPDQSKGGNKTPVNRLR